MNKNTYDALIGLHMSLAEILTEPEQYKMPDDMREKLAAMRAQVMAMVQVND